MKTPAWKLTPLSARCPRIAAPAIDGRPTDDKWRGAARLDNFTREDGAPASARTTAWLGCDDGYLYLAARCAGENTDALAKAGSAYHRDLRSRDHFTLYLNPTHDHTQFYRFSMGPFEQTEAAIGGYRTSYRAGPDSRWFHPADLARHHPQYFRYASTVEPGRAWCFEMAVPFESVDAAPPGPGATWGFNLLRYTAWPVYRGAPTATGELETRLTSHEWSGLSFMASQARINPLAFADLVFGDEAPELIEADFGRPHFGVNQASLRFRAPAGKKLFLAASVRPRQGSRIIDPGGEFPLAPGGGDTLEARFAWKAAHYDDANILDLAVRDGAGGRTVWSGAYEFGWEDGSLPLAYRHRGETDGEPADPDPADPDFQVKKACFIAGRQHRFRRRSTASGAPSDFTLESADGSVRFDLMKPACLDEMAGYVHECYDNDIDRLLGMLFLMGQPALMRAHTAYDPNASNHLETLSLLRFGSGYCGHMARVAATALNRLEVGNTGRRHRARGFGIGGHGLVLVEHRGDYAVLDTKHMAFYYRLDNRDLATLAEMRAAPEIIRRAYRGNIPALMTFDADHIPAQPPDELTGLGLLLPEDAPPVTPGDA